MKEFFTKIWNNRNAKSRFSLHLKYYDYLHIRNLSLDYFVLSEIQEASHQQACTSGDETMSDEAGTGAEAGAGAETKPEAPKKESSSEGILMLQVPLQFVPFVYGENM